MDMIEEDRIKSNQSNQNTLKPHTTNTGKAGRRGPPGGPAGCYSTLLQKWGNLGVNMGGYGGMYVWMPLYASVRLLEGFSCGG